MAEIVSTGLSGLDSQLGGGVQAGTCILLTGQPMNAQELLAYQFGAAADKTDYVATNRPKEEIEQAIEAIQLDSSPFTIRSAANRILKPAANSRFILDNLSDISDRIGAKAAYEYVESIRDAMHKNGQVGLVIAYDGMHTEEEMAHLRVLCDGVMEMGFDRQGFGLYPFLKVTKMRGSSESSLLLLFKETPKGLFMESTRRVQ